MDTLPPFTRLSFFFMMQIIKKEFLFLIYHNGRFHFAQISRSCLDQINDLLQQLPSDQSMVAEQLIPFLELLKAFLPELSFNIDGRDVSVPWSNVIFEGEPGKRRTLKILISDDEWVFAKYLGNQKDLFSFEIRGTNQMIQIPLKSILDHTHPSEAVLKKYDTDIQAKQDSCVKKELQRQDFEERKKCAPVLRFPLTLPRKKGDDFCYPFLEYGDLLVLFYLCSILKVKLGTNYLFNNLLIRFLACGSQKNFFDEVPQLTQTEEQLFNEFQKLYNDTYMGTPMVSNIKRCSNLTVQEVFLKQFEIAKDMKINSQCALKIPGNYFIDPEIGVILRKGSHDLEPHSCLTKLE